MSARVRRIEYLEDSDSLRYVYYTNGEVEVEFKKEREYPFILFSRDKLTDRITYEDAWFIEHDKRAKNKTLLNGVVIEKEKLFMNNFCLKVRLNISNFLIEMFLNKS